MSFKQILQKFDKPFVYEEFENLSVSVLLNDSDNYNFIQFINGINVYNGGKTMDWIESSIINSFKESLPKKYSNIKYGDIKNKISLVVVYKNMKNPRFSDQVKSSCVNNWSQFKDILEDVDLSKISKQMRNNQEIKNNITNYFDMKAEYEKKKELKSLTKPKKKIRIDKYKPAINENKYIMVSEGLSAGSAILSATGRENIGAYPLKGKVLNCMKASIAQIKKNQELKDLIDILGLNLVESQDSFNYENLLIAVDADVDGANILMLLMTLFMTYKREFIQQGRVFLLKTPIVVAYKSGKPKDFIFELSDLKVHQSKNNGFEYKYKKGLASLDESEYEIMYKDGIEPFLEPMLWSDDLPEVFEAWMGWDAQKRKDLLEGSEFDLFSV